MLHRRERKVSTINRLFHEAHVEMGEICRVENLNTSET